MSTSSLRLDTVAHITIDNVYRGVFDTWEGAETKAEVVKHRAGGVAKQTLLKVPSDTDDLTVTILYDAQFHQDLRTLRTRTGKADAQVGLQDLDADRNGYGKTELLTGVLSGYNVTGGDSTSNDKRFLTLTFTLED